MNDMDPIHPGEHLAEILDELGISQSRLARAIHTPSPRIHEIIHGRRAITADTALRLGRALSTTPEYWMNLQRMHELALARASCNIDEVEDEIEPVAAA
ncbi:MAG: HigA family addiction module antitoxin [Gammaproteobacteria bacterium]|nr:HigA family addiction module antitoxin [Gammaproteobacteria bacterium]MCY4278730.1 HigA family addiction module antitoxin [Gammaproteobacteria bacterium]MCY4323212.1 HigA family addiction module antitoxin [Gammaproteobacteria bacterium]